MRSRVPLLVCVLLLLTAVGCGAAPAAAQSDVDETRLEAQLQSDGDARWTITATIPLEDGRDVENFRSFADVYEGGERDFQLGTDGFREAAAAASVESGREMSISGETREATLVNETEGGEVVARYGVLETSFTWSSFARVDENGTMYVDDAFNTSDGTWLWGLEEGQTLVIRSAPGYGGPSTSPTGAVDGDLTWEGSQSFEPGYFYIEYPETGSSLFDASLSTVLLVGALASSAVALFLGVFLLWRREGNDAPIVTFDSDSSGGATEADADSDVSRTEADPDQGPDADPDEESGAADLELLSDEERVEYLLEERGGRMKQATIVKETGWSNAKVSQLLSSMAADERVEKLRIGRENLISLPGENVGDVAADDDEE